MNEVQEVMEHDPVEDQMMEVLKQVNRLIRKTSLDPELWCEAADCRESLPEIRRLLRLGIAADALDA